MPTEYELNQNQGGTPGGQLTGVMKTVAGGLDGAVNKAKSFLTDPSGAIGSAATKAAAGAVQAATGAVASITGAIGGVAVSPIATPVAMGSPLGASKEDVYFKIKIEGPNGMSMIFQASAPVSESRSATYDTYGIVHLPTALYAYRSTGGRRLSIPGRLVSRNAQEATVNSRYLTLIRNWILPDFANTGATPPILKLTAFGNDQIKGLQCILMSYSFTFPDDVDYIFDGDVPMPVIGNLNIELEEIYSADQVTNGDWKIKPVEPGDFGGIGDVGQMAKAAAAGKSFSPSLKGIASIDVLKNVTMNSTLGGVIGGIAGTVLGNKLGPLGAGIGRALGSAVGTSISTSTSVKDVLTSSSFMTNVFTAGLSPASIADQKNLLQQTVIKTVTTKALDPFSRKSNPVPPDLAKFDG